MSAPEAASPVSPISGDKSKPAEQAEQSAPADEAAGHQHGPELQKYEDLEKSILYQVEYYFSKENLKTDAYLKSKMNAQLYVPLDVVCQFKLMKKLTNDPELVKKVLRQSSKVELDESKDPVMIRPKVQTVARATLILRDLKSTVPEQEIRALFTNADEIVSVKPEVGDHWYVLFNSETEAKKAFEESREKLLDGKPVKARVKSENLLRGFESDDGPQAISLSAPLTAAAGGNMFPYGQHGYYPSNVGPPSFMFGFSPYQQHQGPIPHGQADMHQGQHKYPSAHGGGQYGYGQYGHKGDKNWNKQGGRQPKKDHAEAVPPKKTGPPSRQATPKLGPADFPPLPTTTTTAPGYPADQPFRTYTKKQIIDVIFQLKSKELPLPSDLKGKACPAIREVPKNDLELETQA